MSNQTTHAAHQDALQRLLQADEAARDRVAEAEKKAKEIVAGAEQEASSLVEEARSKARSEAEEILQKVESGPDDVDEIGADQSGQLPYITETNALRQQAERNLAAATDLLIAWVTGEET